ncbi:hypothetical protein HYQ46_002376 [Verticillium longisporum]|nr:hypothetical protein HYQ46_002376 [Verticillium longisporum]
MNSATVTSVDSDSSAAPQPTRRPVPLQNQKSNGTTSETPADVTKATTDELRKALQKKYRHVVAVHSQLRPSTLSHDSTAAPSFLGFRNLMVIVLVVGNLRLMIENLQKVPNLMVIVLVVGNLRLMIENLQKYGVLICLHCHDFRRSDILLGLGLYFLIPCHLFAAYLIELVAAHQARGSRVKTKDGSASPTHDQSARFKSTWKIVAWAHALNITLALAVTTLVVYFNIYHPLIGTLTELHAVIVWLKTSSYAFTNRDLRHAYLHPVKG